MRRMRLVAAAALSLVTSLAAAQPAAEGGAVLIRGARVFDGERLIGIRDVRIERGRIAEIGVKLRAPAGVSTIEGDNRTLVPGLIDSHVHVFPGAQADALRFGVTTEFDMFTAVDPATVAARRTQRTAFARTTEADSWSSGNGVTPPGGHPTQLAAALGMPPIPTLADSADADAYVAARVAEGSDYIKIFQDDGAANGRPPSLTPFPPARLVAVIAATHRAGKKAIVHVSSLENGRAAIAGGADALAHMWQDKPADAAFVALARDRRVAIIATLSVLAGVSASGDAARLAADAAIAPHLSGMQRGMLAASFTRSYPDTLAKALENVRRLHTGGVVVLAGTDAPNPSTAHGPSIHQELALLVRGGLTPAQALTAATAAPARFFGADDRGVIAVGKRADLLLVEGDPTTDIAATRRIAGIWKNGYPVDRAVAPDPKASPTR